MTALTTEHAVCALPAEHRDWRHLVIRVQRRGSTDGWVLSWAGLYRSCQSGDSWVPSLADATVFDEDNALAEAECWAPLVDVNGLTAADLLNR